jgi:hypothetical protein
VREYVCVLTMQPPCLLLPVPPTERPLRLHPRQDLGVARLIPGAGMTAQHKPLSSHKTLIFGPGSTCRRGSPPSPRPAWHQTAGPAPVTASVAMKCRCEAGGVSGCQAGPATDPLDRDAHNYQARQSPFFAWRLWTNLVLFCVILNVSSKMVTLNLSLKMPVKMLGPLFVVMNKSIQ